MSKSRTHARSRGITLISLLIALAIGLFLLAGLAEIWYRTLQTFNAQDGLAQLQDSERMAENIIANAVQTAGYYPLYLNYETPAPGTPIPTTRIAAFPINTANTPAYAAAGQFIAGMTTAANGDVLSVRYLADGNTIDCLGQTETAGSLVLETFSVNQGVLQCAVAVNGTATQTAGIINGIHAFQITYGVDTTGAGSVSQYMDAAQVAAAGDWSSVRSVVVTLTLNNPLANEPGQPSVPGQAATLPPFTRTIAVVQQT